MNTIDKINSIMLCDILTHFGVKSEINPKIVKYAIESGNQWILNAEYSYLLSDEPSKEVRDFVISVLNMYRGLSAALRKLPTEQQKEIVEKYNLHIAEKHIQIPGFDGNNEAEYFSVIEAFQEMNKFTEQSKPIANTHSQTIHSYELMLKEYDRLSAVNRSFELSSDEISTVLSKAPFGI